MESRGSIPSPESKFKPRAQWDTSVSRLEKAEVEDFSTKDSTPAALPTGFNHTPPDIGEFHIATLAPGLLSVNHSQPGSHGEQMDVLCLSPPQSNGKI
uniref:Uncharacterized protein n=1 Tax=Knipowitschia caucasica TaxID=637954 RepID=A0AAV2KKA9_KNICA